MSHTYPTGYSPAYHQGSQGMSPALIAAIIDAARPVYEKLLGEARGVFQDGHYEMAVVLSQAAAELCTEATISTLLPRRGIGELADPLMGLVTVVDICNDRLRAVYVTLANDAIEKEGFWLKLKAHRDRRNSIVHRGTKCSAQEAGESVEAVEQFIKHAESVLKRQSDSKSADVHKNSSA